VKISQGQPLDDGSSSGKVPLILNRKAAVQIKATGTAPDPVPVQLTLKTQTVNTSVALSDLTGNNGAFVTFTPSDSQASSLSVTLNNGPVTSIPIKTFAASHPIKYTFVAVNDSPSAVADFNFPMVPLTNGYLLATEPLDSDYSYDTDTLDEGGNPIAHSPCIPLIKLCPGIDTVLTQLSVIALLHNADRAIGIAPAEYMDQVVGAAGVSIASASASLPGVLIEDEFPETAAHELGHTYGLLVGAELYDKNGDCLTGDISASNVYWLNAPANLKSALLGGPFENYMCAAGNADPFYQRQFPDKWATSKDFVTVGAKYTNSSFDPETLIVSGDIGQNGLATFTNYYRNPSGLVSQGQSSGEYQLQLLSSSGTVLSSLYFSSGSVVQESLLTLSDTPFVFSLNYPSNASSIRLLNGSTPIATQSIAYGLLITAVQSLQNGAFIANPMQHRDALLNMVNAFNQQLATGDVAGAQQFLTNGIAPQISSWLSNSYVPSNPLFYAKATLLRLVNELATRLAPAH
jgi:hypothetical protein